MSFKNGVNLQNYHQLSERLLVKHSLLSFRVGRFGASNWGEASRDSNHDRTKDLSRRSPLGGPLYMDALDGYFGASLTSIMEVSNDGRIFGILGLQEGLGDDDLEA